MLIQFEEKDYVVKIVVEKITHFDGDPAGKTTKVYVSGRDHPLLIQENISTVENIIKSSLQQS